MYTNESKIITILKTDFLKKFYQGEETVLWVKYLLCKDEDLRSHP